MAVLSFTNCVIDITIIILCPPSIFTPILALSRNQREETERLLDSPLPSLQDASALLYTSFPVVNLQTCEHAAGSRTGQEAHAISTQAWVKLHPLPSPVADDPQFHQAPASTPSSISCSSHPVPQCCPSLCASCYTGLLYFSRPCTVKLKIFSLFFVVFFLCIICVKYYKPITVQYKIADCVSWVPRLILLALWTNRDFQTYSWNRTHLYLRDLL